MSSGLVNLNIRGLLLEGTTVIQHGFCCGNTLLNSLDLSTLPISIIESDCFRYLHSLTELIFSNELGTIESGSFRGLVSMRRLDFSNCSMFRVFEDDTFVDAHLLKTLILPPELVEFRSAFRGLTSLETLTIPASVMTIGRRAFDGCSRLKQVILRGKPMIDPNAFKRCHPGLTFVHQCSSEVEGCRSQPRQAAAGGGEMRVAVGVPSMHPDLPSPHQSSSKVEGCSLQPGQAAAAAGGGKMEAVVVEPSMHPDSPFRFPCYMGRYDALKRKLQFGQADKGFECQITYDEFVADMEIVILPCGHAFSVTGMLEWYKKRENCPSCNAKLP